jgi:hypothetical protein
MGGVDGCKHKHSTHDGKTVFANEKGKGKREERGGEAKLVYPRPKHFTTTST